ncbi:hypothetical protein ABW20_dc0100029 [Dactylellina cionopaga]|nr:hypothetical protein ABW20_dc0100029 [Dactylellina cionopaga]
MMTTPSSRIPSLICAYLALSILLLTSSSSACGVLTHNEILRRARSLHSVFSTDADNHNPAYVHHEYINRILTDAPNHPAEQAGAFFPDWGYGCFSNDVAAEAAHWPPFVAAAIRHFHKKYGPLYTPLNPTADTNDIDQKNKSNNSKDSKHDDGAAETTLVKNTLWPNGTSMTQDEQEHKEKLLTFIFATTLHGSSDATWHSLKMYNGFIRMVAGLDFSGSYSDAHTLVDTGGDIVLAHRMDGIPAENGPKNWVSKTWWVPSQDIMEIYQTMGIAINRYTFSFCIARGIAAMQAVVSAGGGLYDSYADKSPAMIDFLDEYYLGGIDEMAANAVWCWRNLTEWIWNGADDGSDGWDMCDTFKLIKARNGGKIEPPDPPFVGEARGGSHGQMYADLLKKDEGFREVVERLEDGVYQDEVLLGAVEIFIPDEVVRLAVRDSLVKQPSDTKWRGRDDDDDDDITTTTTTTDKFHLPHPTPSPFQGKFADPIYLSTGKPFSKFGSCLSINKVDRKAGEMLPAPSVDLTASAFVETEDQDYVAGGAVYSINLKDVLDMPTVRDEGGKLWVKSGDEERMRRFTGRHNARFTITNATESKVCRIKASLEKGAASLTDNFDPLSSAPNHPNARFGASTTPLKLKSGIYNVVTAPGPTVYNDSSPKIGFIPSGYLDVFQGATRILRLSFEDLPGGERVGEREFGSVVIAADVDGDGEEEVILGVPFADGGRDGCGVQLGEGEVVVVKMGVLVERALKGCDEVVEGAVKRMGLPAGEKKGEDCNQNTYEWFGRSLVWLQDSNLLGIGAPGRGKVYFWKWDAGLEEMKYEFAISGGIGEGFGGWGLESGISPGGQQWLVVGVPNDDKQVGYLMVYRVVDGEGVLVAKVGSKEQEKNGKFGMVLKGDDHEGGLWVGSPWAEKERGSVWWVDIGAIADGGDNWKGLPAQGDCRQVVITGQRRGVVGEFYVKTQLSGTEAKAHFGASLAVVDIDGDGKSDLVVGIPYSGVSNIDEERRFQGAVAVFVRKDESLSMDDD